MAACWLLLGRSHGRTFEATGHDLDSLLYEFLSELLVDFESDFFICKQINIETFDRNEWRIVAQGCDTLEPSFSCC